MKIPRPRSPGARMLLGATLLMAGLLGCGRRGPPVPPRPAAPAAVGAFRADLRDSAILISWTRPTRNEDGSPLTDLLEFRLFRAVGAAAARESRGRPTFSLLARVRAEQPENALVQDNQYAYQDDGGSAGFSPGVRYSYRMQAVNRPGVVGAQSAEISVDFSLAPPPPVGLSAVAGDGVVNLTWQPAAGEAGVAAARGYNVYRGPRTGEYGSTPINAGPIVETQFRDALVKNETTYYYVVRSVGGERPPWRESVNSSEASVTPVDLTPPAPPEGLTAIPGPGVVSLSWSANTEADLLGYLVYRREPPALSPVRLTEVPVQTTTFTDRTVRPGATYIYSVTAMDRSSHRNESAPSQEASVSLP